MTCNLQNTGLFFVERAAWAGAAALSAAAADAGENIPDTPHFNYKSAHTVTKHTQACFS